MKREPHLIVAGAGVVGLAFVARLNAQQRSGRIRVTIVDGAAQPAYSFDDDIQLRVSAISSGSRELLVEADAWQLLASDRICPYEEMCVWDASSSSEAPDALRFSAGEFGVPELGHIVENGLLRHVLFSRLATDGQRVEFDTSICSIQESRRGLSVSLSSGESLDCDLLVAADGAASTIREKAGIGVKGWQYGQSALVCHLETDKPHHYTAWQRFTPDGPVALLPLLDGRVSTVWSMDSNLAKDVLEWDDARLGNALSSATDKVLGQLRPTSTRAAFALRAQYARQYVLPGLALIGDAAHSVHPLAGQGANLGIADAACLARVIGGAIDNGETIGDYRVLRRYERERKGANLSMLYFVDSLNRLFAGDYSLSRKLRKTGMRLFNSSGPIRDYAVGVALGLKR